MQPTEKTDISVLIPVFNEEKNIRRCLEALKDWAEEIIVVDSQSTDATIEIAEGYGAKVVQFYYKGGLPKKRQWALDTYNFRNEWILLLDADEILLDPIKDEIRNAITSNDYDGYWLRFQIYFLGRQLCYGDTELWKLFLFRRRKGRYEKRLEFHDLTMSDIEVHEHIIVNGSVGRLKNPIRHENINTLDRYIKKHNEYSNWEAKVFLQGEDNDIKPSLWSSQVQRRRWLKQFFLNFPGSPILRFIYSYFYRLGFLDGKQGLIYCSFKAIQMFNVKTKIYEMLKSKQ